jgi:hypothetical protein
MRPIILLATRVPVFPRKVRIGLDLASITYEITKTRMIVPSKIILFWMFPAVSKRTIAVVSAPGPVKRGMARGMTVISSISELLCSSAVEDWVLVLSPNSISIEMIISKIPPAIVKAYISIPRRRKNRLPVTVTMSKVRAAMIVAFFIMVVFSASPNLSRSVTNKGTFPIAFTITKSDRKECKKKVILLDLNRVWMRSIEELYTAFREK